MVEAAKAKAVRGGEPSHCEAKRQQTASQRAQGGPPMNGAIRRRFSALGYRHGKPTARGLFVFREHVATGLAHRFDDAIERYAMFAVAAQRHSRCVDRLHRRHRAAFDARHLYEPTDRIASETKIVLHPDL